MKLNQKAFRFLSLGLLAVVIVVTVIVLASPKPNPGRIEFKGYDKGRALFEYIPTQKGAYFCQAWVVLGEIKTEEYPLHFPFFLSFGDHPRFVVDPPTNTVWRTKVEQIVPITGMRGILSRLQNICHQRKLKAWHEEFITIHPPVFSGWITNNAPRAAHTPLKRGVNESGDVVLP